MMNNINTENTQILSVGDVFKKARHDQSISLDMVHDETKIPMDALKAIEEGYTIRTLSPFYRKSFIKIYANYVNIDVKDVLKEEAKAEIPKHPEPSMSAFDFPQWARKFLTRKRKKELVMGFGVLLVLFLLFKFFSFVATRKPKEKVKISTVQQALPVDKPKPQATVLKPKKIIVKKEPVKVISSTPVQVAVPQTVVAQSTPKLSKTISLTVRATEKSWLRVKSDGTVVFQTTLREGSVETWEADNEIEISGRNLNKLEFEFNGNLIGKLGRADRKAKKVIHHQRWSFCR